MRYKIKYFNTLKNTRKKENVMRRLIAYICMAISVLIAVGVAFTPVFTKMTPGREYTSGNEIVYRLSDKEGGSSVDEAGTVVEKVAEEMRSRLETYKIEDYSVRIEGSDTIRVGLSAKNDTNLNYIAKYLSFSGGDFSLAGKEEETRLSHSEIFQGSTARIVHKENGLIPYVVFPLSPDNATAAASKVKDLISKISDTSGGSDDERAISHPLKAEGDEAAAEPNIFLWANWAEGDDYEKATSKDVAHTGEKIIASFVADNIWYKEEKTTNKKDDDEEEEEPTELQLLCGFAEGEDASKYDTKKLSAANDLATYYMNMFNASKYDVEVTNLFVSESASGVTNNTVRSDATIENLLVFGSDVDVRMSATLIATLVAIGVIFLLLILFYRMGSLALAANTVASVFATYSIFIAMGATFNIAAIVGGIAVAVGSLFIGALYMNKLKEEVYKGRALKKANAEAHKKILLPSIDVAVISAFSGLMFYFIGGNAIRPLGIMLFFGGIVSLVLNLALLRLLTWLLTNSTNMSSNLKLLNIDDKFVPNIMQEEKPTYVAPYENTDFTKRKKPVAIVTGILALGAIAVISVFGALNKSPLNVSNANNKSTEIYLSIKGDNPVVNNEDSFKNDVLANVLVDGKPIEYTDVDLLLREEYDYETEITTKYTYFVTSFDATFAENSVYTVKDSDVEYATYAEAMTVAVENLHEDTNNINVEEKISYETVTAPNQGFVALAAGVAILGSCLYFAFRYRPSRAIGALAVSSVATLLTYGVLVATRIQTAGITSIVMPIAAVISLFAAVIFFEKEKDMLKEADENADDKQIMVKATSLAATPLFITAIMIAYLAINYFAFANGMPAIFAGMLLATLLAVVLTVTLLGPISALFHKWLKKIKLPTIKVNRAKKARIKLKNKPKTSEPEETVFIGIND